MLIQQEIQRSAEAVGAITTAMAAGPPLAVAVAAHGLAQAGLLYMAELAALGQQARAMRLQDR